MIDYARLADGDPDLNGDLQTSFELMKAETVTVQRPSPYRITMPMITSELGRDDARTIYAALIAAVGAGAMDPWELERLTVAGLDIADPEMVVAVQGLATAGLYSQAIADRLIGMAQTTGLKYPDLREQSQLAKARKLRAEGKI